MAERGNTITVASDTPSRPDTHTVVRQQGVSGLLLAMPLLIIVGVLLIWPLCILALRSITVAGEASLSFVQYRDVLTSERYLRAFANTTLLAIASTLVALVVCTPAAIYIEKSGARVSKLLAVLLTIPLSLPGIVIGFFVILNLGSTGVVPKLIASITGERQLAIAYTFWGLLLGYVYFQIPRVVLVLRGAVAGISSDVLDAARVLGAPTWRLYTDIILPTLRPALLSAASLSLATAFGAYGTAATLSRGYRVLPLEIASAFTESFQPGRAASLSLLLVLITITVLLGMHQLADPRAPGELRQAEGATRKRWLARRFALYRRR